jgi:hypothetical protein
MLDIHPFFLPPLDPGFRAAAPFNRRFREGVGREGGEPVRIAIERENGIVSTYVTQVFRADSACAGQNLRYIERIVKFLLWQRGGWKVHFGGPREIGERVRGIYSSSGERAFDAEIMSGIYEQPFTVEVTDADSVPDSNEGSSAIGRNLDGCRVGFDLGASDRKACAVIDGEVVFSEEIPWDPSHQSNPDYHYRGVMDSVKRAASHLPRLNAVGGSAAGVYVNNRVRVGSLYRAVSKADFDSRIAGMFVQIGEELGVPLEIANDGDVTALAGSMSLGADPVLGIAMGSSEAGGYVDRKGHITGWLNELAFCPVDYSPDAPRDEWSGDIGCGVQYFSQQGAIRLAEKAHIPFYGADDLPRKLEILQELAAESHVQDVYRSIGICLGYTLAHYADFYDLERVLILGRVTTGPGGDIIVESAKSAVRGDFPELDERITLSLPDEKSRRVGQSISAASLPSLKKG